MFSVLEVPKLPNRPIEIYGSLRRQFSKNRRPQYSVMLMKGTLLDHLADIDDICHKEISESDSGTEHNRKMQKAGCLEMDRLHEQY